MGVASNAVSVLEQMFPAWPGFATLAPQTGIDNSVWQKITTEDSDGTTPQLPLALDIIHYADGTVKNGDMLGEDVFKRVRILLKIYVFDDRRTPQASRAAKTLLEDLTDETYRMVMQSMAAYPFGAVHSAGWYQVVTPDDQQTYAKYSRRDKERFSLSIYDFLIEQENPLINPFGD